MIMLTNHSALRYLFTKQAAKSRLIRWILMFQEFDMAIRNKKGAKNRAANHLSRLENSKLKKLTKDETRDMFPEEKLMSISDQSNEPWLPKALISDRGTHFCNYQMERAMKKYEVVHRFSTAYHPQTNSQVKNTNQAIKRILEKQLVTIERIGQTSSTTHYGVLNGFQNITWNDALPIDIWTMKSEAIELCDKDGNDFIVNRQRVKPYSNDLMNFNSDDDLILDNQDGGVT
nr:hypothetical protein [Tanacetum cinerariifolium]